MAQPRAHFTKWLMILRYAREGGKLIHSAKGKERSRRLQHASGFSSGNWKFSDKKRLLMNLGVDWRETKTPFHVGKPLLFFLLSLRSVIKHFMMIMTFLFYLLRFITQHYY